MATIGYVTKREDGRYEGELRTLSIRADISILPVPDKTSDSQPDFRVMSQGIEIGAGCLSVRSRQRSPWLGNHASWCAFVLTSRGAALRSASKCGKFEGLFSDIKIKD